MERPTRRAELSVTYNNADITAELAPMLVGFEYVDVVDGKHADSLTLFVQNTDRRWFGEWLPGLGATLSATLTCNHWPGGKVLECGKFEIDGISFADRPNTCTIKALAAGVTSSLRRELVTKAWESIAVWKIADEIAVKHGFELYFDVDTVLPAIDRYDQREQSDNRRACPQRFGTREHDGGLADSERRYRRDDSGSGFGCVGCGSFVTHAYHLERDESSDGLG